MSTVTVNETVATALDKADPNKLGDLLALVKLGTMLTPLQAAVSQTSAATATLSPPALGPQHVFVRVTAGAAAAGIRDISDAADTPSATLATLSADGTTLTFEAAVTDFVLDYLPRPEVSMSQDFPTTGID